MMDSVSENQSPVETIIIALNESANSSESGRNEQLAQFEIATLSCIFIVTVIGNTLVLLALCARKHCAGRKKLSRMYFFILHLCIADLVTAVLNVLPQLIWDITYRFKGNNFLCKTVKFSQLVGPYLSSYILIATALDRYRAICYPLTYNAWTAKRSRIMVLSAWSVSVGFSLPQLFVFSYQEVQPNTWDCWATFVQDWGQKAYVTWYSISIFIVPLCFLVFTYMCICRVIWKNAGTRLGNSMQLISRAKVNTVKQTVAVITLYVVCSSPFIAAQLWATWDPDAMKSPFWSGPSFTILSLLSTLNSCANPWIYLLFNKELVKALRMLIPCCPSYKLPSSGYENGHSNSDSSFSHNKSHRRTNLGCSLWRRSPCEENPLDKVFNSCAENGDEYGTTMTEVTNTLLPLDFR